MWKQLPQRGNVFFLPVTFGRILHGNCQETLELFQWDLLLHPLFLFTRHWSFRLLLFVLVNGSSASSNSLLMKKPTIKSVHGSPQELLLREIRMLAWKIKKTHKTYLNNICGGKKNYWAASKLDVKEIEIVGWYWKTTAKRCEKLVFSQKFLSGQKNQLWLLLSFVAVCVHDKTLDRDQLGDHNTW